MDFDIYTQDIKIKDKTYTIRPLTGEYLPKLYGVMSQLGLKEGEEFDLSKLNEDTMGKLHELALESFKKSYPQEDEHKLDEFISQNLLLILEALIKVNVSTPENASRSG